MFLYGLSMLLTVADIIAIAGSGAYLFYLYTINDLLTEDIFMFGGIIVACFIALPVIDILRRKSRTASKYDRYGRLKQISGYERMSVQEQKAMEKERIRELERILPSTAVREMTHAGSKDPDLDLSKMIGLEQVKERVEEMEARMASEYRKKKGDGARHMVFFGPPGTGKTTVVSIMTAYLFRNKCIRANRYIQVNGSFFTGPDAAARMDAIVQRAFGGVLFVDEAYAIMESSSGNEALNALLSQMEDNRDKFVLVMAGYEDEMKDLLRSNPGFLSRIAEFLYFRSYTVSELYQVFVSMARAAGYEVGANAAGTFSIVMEQYMQETSFGNARTCRSLLDRSISRHCLRIKRERRKEDNILEAADIVYEPNPLAN